MKYAVSFFVCATLLMTPLCHALSDAPEESRTFADIGTGTAFSEAIHAIAEKGIVQGYEDGTYKPLKKINRAEFTKIIIEAKYPGEAQGTGCFSDVTDEWFAKYVCFAQRKGVVKGNPDGTFRPASEINTAEAYKIVFETMLENPIYDENGEWYYKYLEYAAIYDLNFDPDLDPSHQVTRGEMAEMIHRVLKNNEVGEYEQAILTLVNNERAKSGLTPLTYSKVLERSAYNHARDMHQKGYFSHISPEGTDSKQRMSRYYEDRSWTSYGVGENLWEWEQPSSYNVDALTDEAMYGDFGWMQSVEHRGNILNPNFKELGIGYYRAPNGKVYFVQNFGAIGF